MVESSSDEKEEVEDPKLDKTEAELKKISTGMANVFLEDLAVERKRRAMARSTRHIDPRSAARCPAANREPPFRLRYDSPVNASPSRIADHLRSVARASAQRTLKACRSTAIFQALGR